MDRAQEGVSLLIQDCKVTIRHVVAPGAMGTADPAAPNVSAQGRAANRRVEVKVLLNRGLARQLEVRPSRMQQAQGDCHLQQSVN